MEREATKETSVLKEMSVARESLQVKYTNYVSCVDSGDIRLGIEIGVKKDLDKIFLFG